MTRLPIALAALLFAVACGTDTPDFEALSGTDHDLAMERGAPAATALAQELSARLTEAIAEGGPAHAVDFCSHEAIPLTQAIEANLDAGIEIKRTSFRWRNPDNAPDDLEAVVLRHLQGLGDEAPEALTGPGPDGTLRYYRTLRTGTQCLACHGGEAELDPEAARQIAEAYPDDRATGYGEGDLRGVIRVQIPR